jgi:hypothetical protein
MRTNGTTAREGRRSIHGVKSKDLGAASQSTRGLANKKAAPEEPLFVIDEAKAKA